MTANPDPAALSGEIRTCLDEAVATLTAIQAEYVGYRDATKMGVEETFFTHRIIQLSLGISALNRWRSSTPSPQPEPPAPPPGEMPGEVYLTVTLAQAHIGGQEKTVEDRTIIYLATERERLVQDLAEAKEQLEWSVGIRESALKNAEADVKELRAQLSTLQEAAAQKNAYIERLKIAGAKLANGAYNLSQWESLNPVHKDSLKQSYEEWDAVLSSSPGATSRDDQ